MSWFLNRIFDPHRRSGEVSGFLERFAELLSDVPPDANIGKTWSKLAPLVCESAGHAWQKGGLWLYDYHDTHAHLTLWHWWSDKSESSGSPEHVTSKISYDDDTRVLGGSPSDHIRPSQQILSERGLLSGTAQAYIIPIIANIGTNKDTSERIGLFALFSDEGAELSEELRKDLKVACRLLGAWMHLNREWRKASALAEFQKASTPTELYKDSGSGNNIAMLAHSAASQLISYASAQVAAIYVPDKGELKRIGVGNSNELGPAIEPGNFLHRFHFGRIENFLRTKNDTEVQIEFDANGRFMKPDQLGLSISAGEFPEIEFGSKPISILVARIKDTPENGDDTSPIATLMMATSSTPDFLGGRFSDTNREVMRLVLQVFGNRYSLALQAERLDMLARRFEAIAAARQNVNIKDSAQDMGDFSGFACLARDALPNVADAVVYFVSRDNKLQRCWRTDIAENSRPDWAPNERHIAPQASPPPWVGTHRIDDHNGGKIWLHLLQQVKKLPAVEQMLLERILAEARIAYRLQANKDDWARQLAEVRHNLRAVLASVLGKIELLGNRYEAVRDKTADEVHRRLVVEGLFRKNMQQLMFSGKELEAIFENIRALVGKLDKDSLQIREFDLPNLVRSTVLLLDVEARRREMNFIFIDHTRSETRRVIGDPMWTRIALFNLFENAIKYSDRSGQVVVTLQMIGGHWQLRVVNEGRYIPPEMEGEIFEPYRRVQHPQGQQAMPGTGLGLMTLRQVVNMHQNPDVPVPHGGSPVLVESEPIDRQSNGQVVRARTSFTISLPRKGP